MDKQPPGGAGEGDHRRPSNIKSPGLSTQTEENLRIIKEIEEKKQRYMKHGSQGGGLPLQLPPPSGHLSPSVSQGPPMLGSTLQADGGGNFKNQKLAAMQALQHAKANSSGYYITQPDSQFGNLFIPVLPRPYESLGTPGPGSGPGASPGTGLGTGPGHS